MPKNTIGCSDSAFFQSSQWRWSTNLIQIAHTQNSDEQRYNTQQLNSKHLRTETMIIHALKTADMMVVAGSMMIGWVICFYYSWRTDQAIDARTNLANVYIVVTIYEGSPMNQHPNLTSTCHNDTDGNTAPSSSLPSQQQQEIPTVQAQVISNDAQVISNETSHYETPHAEFIRVDAIP